MNRSEYLEELRDQEIYNLIRYSKDRLGEKPKEEYIKEWQNQKEKIELIDDLLEEDKEPKKFKLYTTIYNIYNNLSNKIGATLAMLNDFERGISAYLTLRRSGSNFYYELVYSIHNKKKYDEEYENVATQKINKEVCVSKEKLKDAMSKCLEGFAKFIENDKKTGRRYERYYEEEYEDLPRYYVVNSDKRELYNSISLQDAIKYSEKIKREYMRELSDIDVWVESDKYEGRIYKAIGYERENEFEI